MPELIKESEQIERVRRSVIALGGHVTVGDIMSQTGLGREEASDALNRLIQSHEGTMRVSEHGELMYAFKDGCILRDQRSWWDRHRKQVMKMIKTLFKIIIMLVLVIYFVIYLCILIALLTSNRNNRSNSIDLGWAFYLFWGRSGSTRGSHTSNKAPLYTRIFNFVFGPEEAEVDPLGERALCAQLIRAKNGILTVEDWMMVSGQTREKCESDLARYTAEFNGSAEISDNGTLLYVFEDMMRSTDARRNDALPALAWEKLDRPRPLTGNTPETGGNGVVIGLNLFNLVMAGFFMTGMSDVFFSTAGRTAEEIAMQTQLAEELAPVFFGLGVFPLVFSALIFLGPLVRLPGNLKENKRRRRSAVRKATLQAVLDGTAARKRSVSFEMITKTANRNLSKSQLPGADNEEVQRELIDILDELGGELDLNGQNYTFEAMETRLMEAQKERKARNLSEQSVGKVVYSTDTNDQRRIDEQNARDELDAFDALLAQEDARGGAYDTDYGQASRSDAQNRYASR